MQYTSLRCFKRHIKSHHEWFYLKHFPTRSKQSSTDNPILLPSLVNTNYDNELSVDNSDSDDEFSPADLNDESG